MDFTFGLSTLTLKALYRRFREKTAFRSIFAFFLILSASLSVFCQVNFGVKPLNIPEEKQKYVSGEIIVKFSKTATEEEIQNINRKHGTTTLSISKRGGFRRIRIPKNISVEEAINSYKKDPQVEYAEPNYIYHAHFTPNDPYYPIQWHLYNPVYGGIRMNLAWNIQTGSPDVIVAVVDTGVAYENFGKYQIAPDLANTHFVPGYDFVGNDTHANDDDSHGTHVTGTIAQSTNNGIGAAGVAFNTSIMPVKVLNRKGDGTTDAVANGIYFAADNGAKVINMSLGGSSPSVTLENAVAYAYNHGVTIVCSAGNEYESGNLPNYPAAYNAYCIAVGATRYDETRAYYSNTGSYLDIAAPGGDINVDQNNDGNGDGILQQTFNPTTRKVTDFGYWLFQGTSMAAPHVSGVAALLIANGVTGPDNVRTAIQNTAKDKGPAGWDAEYGWGIVNAYAALNYFPPLVHDVAITDVSSQSIVFLNDVVEVSVTAENLGDYQETFTIALDDITNSSNIGSQPVTLDSKSNTVLTFWWDTTGASTGVHELRAAASIVSGETNTANNTDSTMVEVKLPVHDVAIIAVDSPMESFRADMITIHVTAHNQGTFSETTIVTVTDITDGVIIGTQPVALDPGESDVLHFDWNTISASLGEHIIRVEAGVVAGEIDTADNLMETSTTIIENPNVPQITNIAYSGASVIITFTSLKNYQYNIYYKDAFDDTWTFLEQISGDENLTQYIDDGTLSQPVPEEANVRFYRVGM